MAALEQQLAGDLSQAIKDRNSVKLATLRLLKSAVEKEKKTGKKELTDDEIVKIIKSEVKKRQEASDIFKTAGRNDQALKELEEMAVLKAYLPPEISDEELEKIVAEVLTGNSYAQKDFGLVMKEVMARTKGRADGARVSGLVKQKLSA